MSEPTHHPYPIVSPVTHLVVCGLLLLLTAVNVGASFLNLHAFNGIIAIAVAVIESVLVVLYLMHVKDSSRLTKLTIFAGVFTFLILIGMSFTDYVARAWGQW